MHNNIAYVFVLYFSIPEIHKKVCALPHPLCSSNFISSNFCLFSEGTMKTCMKKLMKIDFQNIQLEKVCTISEESILNYVNLHLYHLTQISQIFYHIISKQIQNSRMCFIKYTLNAHILTTIKPWKF